MLESRGASLAIDVLVTETRGFEAKPDEADKIDTWVETVAARWDVDQRTVFGARLCIAELFANALEHGRAKPGHDRIIVTLERRGDGLGIEFRDSCPPFDPTAHPMAEKSDSIDTVAINGRGLMLVRAYAAEFSYRYDGACNRVTLSMKSH